MKRNYYYVFSIQKYEDFGPGLEIDFCDYVKLTPSQLERLKFLSLPQNDYFFVYSIVPKDKEVISSFENGNYYNDCNKQLCSLLQNKKLYGSSSRRINDIFRKAFKICAEKNSLYILGDDGWTSLSNFFDTLNSLDVPYLVLRKFEELPHSYLDGDHDIDILCSSLEDIVLATGAKKRNNGISGYCLRIKDDVVDFDIRFVGDNYYDSQWARAMLEQKSLNENGIYVMDDVNQLFSIMYHCLTQKKTISEYYNNQICCLSKKIFGYAFPENPSALCCLLAFYMKHFSYNCLKPLDISVIQNKKNIKLIKKITRNKKRRLV